MKNNIWFTMDISETDIAGYLFILATLIGLVLKASEAVVLACIGAATTLLSVSKVSNTMYDNAHKDVKND